MEKLGLKIVASALTEVARAYFDYSNNSTCRWRGSVYKLVWRELLAYLGLYYTINVVYRYALNDDQKR